MFAVLALRHQLLVLQRNNRDRRLRLSVAARLLWVWLSQLWNGWRSALVIVNPETVIAWHRRGFRMYWGWKSRHRQGRPAISREVIDLIRRMSIANPRWGAPRIHGELLGMRTRREGICTPQAFVANTPVNTGTELDCWIDGCRPRSAGRAMSESSCVASGPGSGGRNAGHRNRDRLSATPSIPRAAGMRLLTNEGLRFFRPG